jgi:hypothetical protein
MFYKNKVYRSVGLYNLSECWNILVECRGKPGKLSSSFLNFLGGSKLYCHSNLACEGLACLRPVQINRICHTLRISRVLLSCPGRAANLSGQAGRWTHKLLLQPNGSRVWAESGGGAVPPLTCPGALAEKLSRRASHHGAVFANPGANIEKLITLSPIPVLVDD